MRKLINTLDCWIRRSESYIKTDMIYLVHGGFWLTFGRAAIAISGLILSIFFANFVSSEVYGNYRYLLSISGIIAAFSLTGMSVAITQSVSKGFEGALKKGFNISIKWGLIMMVISFAASIYYLFNNNTTLSISLIIIGVSQPIFNSFNLYGAFLNGKKDFKRGNLYQMYKSFFVMAIMIITIFITKNTILIVFSYFVSNIIIAIFLYKKTFFVYKPNNNLIDKNMITYSKHLSIMGILGVVAAHIDKILVFHFLGATELAVYAFAVIMPEQIREVFRNLSALTLPKFSEKENLSEIRKTLFSKTLYFIIILIFASICYIFLSPLIFTYIFPQYTSSVVYSQLFVISLIGTIAVIPISALRSQQKEKLLYKLNISSSVIQIILLMLLAYTYGIWGVIVARIISRYTNAFIAYMLVLKNN